MVVVLCGVLIMLAGSFSWIIECGCWCRWDLMARFVHYLVG